MDFAPWTVPERRRMRRTGHFSFFFLLLLLLLFFAVPFVSRWRGDLYFVANLLGALMQCQVEVAIDRYSHLDTTICWQPRVRYSVLIPGLTPEEYRERTETMEPLVAFLKEWFIPFDVRCEVNIKEHHPVQGTHGRVTLDYNTEVKNNKE